MATIINNPDTGNKDSGIGFLVGIIIFALLVFMFILYGIPAIRHSGQNNGSGATINVPDKVDVNLNENSNK